MRTQRIVAIISAASLFLSSGAVLAQADRTQEQLDKGQRGDPRSGDARTATTARDMRAAH